MVLETLRLLAGISWSHGVDGRKEAMTWEYISVVSREDVFGLAEKPQVGFQKKKRRSGLELV